MKATTAPRNLRLHLHTASLALTALLAITISAQAQSNNFNSGTLTGWTTTSCSNFPATFSFVPDVYGGYALRMVATTAPVQTNGGLETTPRAMAWETTRVYGQNFFLAADLVGWNPSTDRSTNDAVVGVMASVVPYSTAFFGYYANPNIPVGQPDGIVFGTRYNANGGPSSGTRGQANMYWIAGGQVGGAIAQGDYTIAQGHSYRLVLVATNNPDGQQYFFGYVYDLQDLTAPLLTLLGSDSPGQSYMPGGANSGSLSNYMGLFSIGYRSPTQGTPPKPTDDYWTTNRGADVTFDNFVAADSPPTSVSFPATPYGLAGLPQVVNRQPISWANFYPAAGGISFTATTLGGGNVTSAKLFLNGMDVSSSLNNPAAGNSRNFSFPGSGLAANTVYDARIELANALGQKTTNIWTFDTFSDAYLASAVCKNIECEDVDFGGGLFIDNPPVSGFTSNTTYFERFNQGYNSDETPGPGYNTLWTPVINSGSGYVNQLSVTNTDFFDYDSVGTLAPHLNRKAGDNQFDQVNPFGTSQGSLNYEYGWYNSVSGGPEHDYSFTYDTQRQKYFNQDPNLQEYMLERTEGGEWVNYTRIFTNTSYYNVYLRHGCELTQPVRLDLIAGGTTKNLGTFYLTNAFAKCNYRYAPLVTLVTPPNSLIVNGSFAANVLSFTSFPGYIGSPNPSSIASWTGSGGVLYGLNGPGTSVGSPFSPVDSGGLTYAFLQGTGQALVQHLTTLAPSTTYQLAYSVAGRAGNTSSYRVVVYSDNTFTTTYYDSGVQPADSGGFVTVTASFTTPALLGAAPNIQLGNASVAGDNTVDYANVFLVPGSSPVPSSSLAVVNLSSTNTLRLTMASAQGDATKQGLMLNYMAFVPALLVESSSQVNTGYTIDNTASINQNTRTITIPKSGAVHFYRLRWPGNTVSIKSTTLVGSDVVLTY